MTSQVTLTDMPEDVMNMILENLNFLEIQALRKVCHDLRNFIDAVEPDSKLIKLEIWVRPRKIEMLYWSRGTAYVEYQDSQLGCALEYRKKTRKEQKCWDGCSCLNGCSKSGKREKLLEDEDFRERAIKDLELILKNQTSTLTTSFEILNGYRTDHDFRENTFLPFLKGCGNILKSRLRPLKTHSFYMDPIDQQEVLLILPFIDSDHLEKIVLFDSFYDETRPESTLAIGEIMKLDQWKKAKEIELELYTDLSNFHEKYAHFETIDIQLMEVSSEDLLMLKQEFISSSSLQSMSIRSENVYDKEQRPYGEPLRIRNVMRHEGTVYWYYHIPSSERIVEILLFIDDNDVLFFNKIEKVNVLENAVIQL